MRISVRNDLKMINNKTRYVSRSNKNTQIVEQTSEWDIEKRKINSHFSVLLFVLKKVVYRIITFS